MSREIKTYLLIGTLFTFALIAIGLRDGNGALAPESGENISTETEQLPASDNAAQKISQLEAELARLSRRVAQLEAKQGDLAGSESQASEEIQSVDANNPDTASIEAEADVAETGYEGLIAAGVEAYRAEEIMRLENELQLKRLELRDQAYRDGTIGTAEFREAMRELSSGSSLRDQIDEDVYDRYLYHTGQSNRVQVQNVIRGSAADQVGLENGDILLRYDDKRLFNFRELNRLTRQGERGEAVNMIVIRNGSEITLTLPRGPVGVQLGSFRQDPRG